MPFSVSDYDKDNRLSHYKLSQRSQAAGPLDADRVGIHAYTDAGQSSLWRE